MKKTITTLLIMLYALMFSCQQDHDELKKQDNKIPDDVVAKLQEAGFDTSEGLLKYKNGYLVEYDIFLTMDQINNLTNPKSNAKNERVEHYRTNNLITGTPRTLRVYIDPGFGTYMQNSFNTALSRYNALGLGIAFQSVGTAAAADISILSFYEVSNILGYSAGFPSGGNPASPIRLNTYYYNNSSGRPDAATVIAHEIGHAIGFRHTDYMNRTFSCGSGGNEGDAGVGAVHIPGTPTTPSANSWMLACSNNTDRPFTSQDVTAMATLYGSQWQVLPGAAYDIGVGANGSAFVIGTNAVGGGFGIYQWNGSSWNNIPGGAVRIAVSPAGVPWVVNNAGNIFRKNATGWDLLPGLAKDIAIGANGSVFVIGTNAVGGGYGIYQWNGSGWNTLSGGAVRIAVSPAGVPWVVNDAGNIFRRNGSGWDLLPGLGKDIGIGANGFVFVIGTNAVGGGFGIYQWTGATWNVIPGGATNISVGPTGKPWVVNNAGNIFRWQ